MVFTIAGDFMKETTTTTKKRLSNQHRSVCTGGQLPVASIAQFGKVPDASAQFWVHEELVILICLRLT